MGPKFSVFIFVLCLYALMVSQAQSQGRGGGGGGGGGGGRGGFGLHDIIKTAKYQRSIENLQFLTPNKAHGRKFRENDVKIGEK